MSYTLESYKKQAFDVAEELTKAGKDAFVNELAGKLLIVVHGHSLDLAYSLESARKLAQGEKGVPFEDAGFDFAAVYFLKTGRTLARADGFCALPPDAIKTIEALRRWA